jgi:hypothetical protein
MRFTGKSLLKVKPLPETPTLIDALHGSCQRALGVGKQVPTGGDAELPATREQRIANVTKIFENSANYKGQSEGPSATVIG